MNPLRSNVGTLNEILFEKRNKNYGAYVIRSTYNNTVFKSLLFTVSFFLIGFFVLSFFVNTKEELKFDTGGNIIKERIVIYEAPKPKEVKPAIPRTEPSSGAATRNTLSTLIKDSVPSPVNTAVNTQAVSTGTGSLTATDTPPNTGSVTSIPTPTTTTVNGGDSEHFPDVMPSFDGLGKFLRDNLVFPRAALENGVSGKVAINFIIDEEGKIIQAKVIKSVGYGCDEEALRVIKLMPKWKPGIKDGKPVKVTFNQAFLFKLQ